MDGRRLGLMDGEKRRTRPGDGPDRIYGALKRAIIGRAIAPGAPLPEGEVAERFGVSRTVVRAALTRLIENGLAVRPANRGTRVAAPSLADALDAMALRRGVEGIVSARLAGRLSDAQLRLLRAHVAEEETAAGRDAGEAIRLSGEFHVLLAEATGSPLLLHYVSELVSRSSLALAANRHAASQDCGPREHRALLEALAKPDGAAACACMDDHLRSLTNRALRVPAPAARFADLPPDLLAPEP